MADGKSEIYDPDDFDDVDHIEDISKKMMKFHELSSKNCLACIHKSCVYQIKKSSDNFEMSD